MTLVELRYIVAVAHALHFGKAARQCFVSQPTLSVGVKKIEDELGVAIFERLPSGVQVTRVGAEIVAQAGRVLDGVEAIRELVQANGDPLAQPLRLGTIYTIGPYLLPMLLPTLHRLAPNMQLLIQENYTARLQEQLTQGKLDVAILSLPFADDTLHIEPLYDEPFQLALPEQHRWREGSAITAQDLLEESVLLLGTGNCFRDQVLQFCPGLARSQDPKGIQKTLEGSSLETILYMVASGAGVTVLPRMAARVVHHHNQMLVYRDFADPAPHRTVIMAWRKSFVRPQAIAVLRQAVRAAGLVGVSLAADQPVAS